MNRPLWTCCAALLLAAAPALADELTQFGVDAEALKKGAASVVSVGLDAAPSPLALAAKPLKDASPQVRAALVKGALGVVRAFLDSTAGKNAVAELTLDAPPRKPDDELAEAEKQQAAMKIEDVLVGVPKAQQAEVRKAFEQMKKDMAAQLAQSRANLKAGQDEWKQAQARWEQQRAEEVAKVKGKLVAVLTTFLADTKAMPWDAKLKADGGRQLFVDPKLEDKPRWWKMCFRAGKDGVDAARTFAEGWLAALKKQP